MRLEQERIAFPHALHVLSGAAMIPPTGPGRVGITVGGTADGSHANTTR